MDTVYTEDNVADLQWVQRFTRFEGFPVIILSPVKRNLSYDDIHIWALLLSFRRLLQIPAPWMVDKEPNGTTAAIIFNRMSPIALQNLLDTLGRILSNVPLYLARMLDIFEHPFVPGAQADPLITVRTSGWLSDSQLGLATADWDGPLVCTIPGESCF